MTRAARTTSRRWRGCGARRSAGAGRASALGWGVDELADVAAEQMRKMAFAHIFGGRSHEPAIALAEKLKEISPFPAGKVFFANSGSEANDTQIKIAWYAANARGVS